MNKKIKLLDATLRDGGQGLDDLFNNGFTDKFFSEDFKKKTIDCLEKARVDIIEIGAMEPSKDNKSQSAIYQNVEQLSKYIPNERKDDVMYAGLYIGPDTDITDIPEWDSSLVEGIRVILRYSELQKSIDFCAALSKKGYKVFVQPMLTMRYTNDELDLIIKSANEMGAYACYFVDSYGYMQNKDIKRLFDYYDQRLDNNIRLGFHAHNNMNLAFSNVVYFLGLDTSREVIIDSCATGMGQGAGNLQTEIIVNYLNNVYGGNYEYEPILEVCENLDNDMISDNLWGYSVTRLLPAIYKTAYKYALVMRNKYHLSLMDINRILHDMPDELRNRYTLENLERIINIIK